LVAAIRKTAGDGEPRRQRWFGRHRGECSEVLDDQRTVLPLHIPAEQSGIAVQLRAGDRFGDYLIGWRVLGGGSAEDTECLTPPELGVVREWNHRLTG
jgi:hypothetical protein